MERKILITSGRGPKECGLAVQYIWSRLQKEAEQQGIALSQKEIVYRDGLPCSVVCLLQGDEVHQMMRKWIGTILWICQSPFRPKYKRKNWFVAVIEVPGDLGQVDCFHADIVYQAIRSSGPGGQHVNKVSSAIQATYIPTGVSVKVMETRSQVQNKQLATERLKQKLAAIHQKKRAHSQHEQWQDQSAIARGNPKSTFVGMEFRLKIES